MPGGQDHKIRVDCETGFNSTHVLHAGFRYIQHFSWCVIEHSVGRMAPVPGVDPCLVTNQDRGHIETI